MGNHPAKLIVPVIALALMSGVSFGAEAVKLRHVQSVYADEKEAGLRYPEGVACDDQGNVLVADSGNGRLVRFATVDGKASPGREIKVPELSFPIRVRIDSKGEILALDGRQKRIVRLGPGGEYRGRVEIDGSIVPATVVPRSFDIGKDDSIYLLDVFGGRVLVLGPDGKLARQLDFPPDYEVISDLAVDAGGNIYLIDSVRSIVYKAAKGNNRFSPLTASMRDIMKFPATIVTDPRGNLYIADKNGGVIYVINPDGSLKAEQLKMGWTEGLLYYPEQMCINKKEELAIADRGNNRVQLFSIRR